MCWVLCREDKDPALGISQTLGVDRSSAPNLEKDIRREGILESWLHGQTSDEQNGGGVVWSPLLGSRPWGVALRSGCPSVTRQEASGALNPGADGPADCLPKKTRYPRDEGHTRLLTGDLWRVVPQSESLL